MLHRIKSLFSRDAKRGIYVYRYNGQVRRLDPLAVMRAIDEHPTWLPSRDSPLLTKQNKFGREAVKRTLQGIRDVFKIEPLQNDGSGLTDDETFNLFADFWTFCSALKKNTETQPSIVASTEDCPPVCEDTNQKSDCGSTDTACFTSDACPSLTP